ncbi:hypothetical protein [Jannaschia ovalis]|uniref:Argininosuccinate lyase n=1 Tax=Jannaschia ovalis TaxID=3038773 RepID=A0ABY8LGV9_9RHOB|nr:hypothetical protein [Jannaschia sp. GRR-S6-38]WGH79409.1 hypothetical protein P8627_03850 [Jannaschia sp. GRR-S6-38]
MIRLAPLVLAAALAACGADGPPLTPAQARAEAAERDARGGITVSGSAEIGVTGSF